MASCIGIWSGFVHGRVDQETSGVCWSAGVASYRFSLVVHQDHITRFQQAKVFPQWVGPEGVDVLWVSDLERRAEGLALTEKVKENLPYTDMTTHSLCVPLSRKYTKGNSHMLQNVLSVVVERYKSWNARQANSLRDHLQRSLFLVLYTTVLRYRLGHYCCGLDLGIFDRRWSHSGVENLSFRGSERCRLVVLRICRFNPYMKEDPKKLTLCAGGGDELKYTSYLVLGAALGRASTLRIRPASDPWPNINTT